MSSTPKPQEEQFARVPEGVLFDSALKPIDVRVFAAIVCGLWRGNHVYPNQSALAEEIGSSRSQVTRSIKKLKTEGHLQQTTKKIGRAVSYIVTSPLFLRGAETPVIRVEKHGGRRIV